MTVGINSSVGPVPSSGGAASGGTLSVADIRSQQQDLRLQQQQVQQQIVSGQIPADQGLNKINDLENKVKDLDNKVLDANNAANSASQNGGAQAAPPAAAPVGFSGVSTFEDAPRSPPPVVLDPLDKSGGGSKPGASSGIGLPH